MAQMSTDPRHRPGADLQSAALLAATLERLERAGGALDPAQYRLLAQRLGEQLRSLEGHPRLRALLERFPSAADLYENLQYANAGMCLHSLEQSLSAEVKMRMAIDQAARRN
ncbi:MAG: hypothetical protein R3E83_22845 [Burkholderiaceae bacterium]